jgi:hypothetical protein
MNSVAENVIFTRDCLAVFYNNWQYTTTPYFLLQEKRKFLRSIFLLGLMANMANDVVKPTIVVPCILLHFVLPKSNHRI